MHSFAEGEIADTIKLVAKIGGIFLDPSYTAKAMHGLIQLIKASELDKDDVVVFLHSGGVPMLFARRWL
ncbi:MAG: hypothetical protein JRN11_05285 [Nitrososphaerota archaeon]|nr:hypothetical protein [Nitrososphaerota archaeon]MDG7026143.1 hypothetical protein [Nitrososphaerota archaeon]